MSELQKQLKAVHDELTRLMAESKMDVPSRQKLAAAANQVADINRKLAEVTAKQAHSTQDQDASRPKKRSLIRRAMELLAKVAALVERIMNRGYDDGS